MQNHKKIFSLMTFQQRLDWCVYLFDKVNGFIRDFNGTKYLVLFRLEKCDAIYDRIRYLIGLHIFFL